MLILHLNTQFKSIKETNNTLADILAKIYKLSGPLQTITTIFTLKNDKTKERLSRSKNGLLKRYIQG